MVTRAEIQETILNCIPSRSLLRAVRESGNQLSFRELLAAAYRYARTFDERIRFLELLQDCEDKETAAMAQAVAEYQRRLMECFQKPCEGEVFELVVEDTSETENRALCASFETARQLYFRMLRECYEIDSPETASEEIRGVRVVKRRVAAEAESVRCTWELDDEAFVCDMNPEGEIRRIYDDRHILCADGGNTGKEPPAGGSCDECPKICPARDLVRFPEYLKSGDLVRWDGAQCVYLAQESIAPEVNCEEYYLIDLNDESIRRIWRDPSDRNFLFSMVSCYGMAVDTEKIEITDLDEQTRGYYEEFMRFYEEYEREREIERQKGECGE